MEAEDVQLVKHQGAVTAADDFMPVFEIGQAVKRREAMVQFVQQILVEGTDFGKLPGSDRPCLLKPGAEKLSTFFGLVAAFELEESVEDWTGQDHGGEPFFYYRYKCRLLKNGRSIGEGVGSCNSWESKYRYRWVQESALPDMVADVKARLQKREATLWEPGFAIEKGETTGRYGKPAEYWQRFRDAIANGTARGEKRESKNGKEIWGHVIGGTLYRIPNPDVADQVNTFQKMGQKRSQVAAVLVGVNASEYFTQDLEDAAPEHTETSEHVAERRIAEEKAKMSNGAPQQSATSESTDVVPAAVQVMWAHMSSMKGCCEQLEELKRSLVEVLGQEKGEWTYYQKLERHGVKHANELKSSKAARLCARDLYDAIQNEISLHKKEQAPIATDADLPDQLWPDEKPNHPSPYTETDKAGVA